MAFSSLLQYAPYAAVNRVLWLPALSDLRTRWEWDALRNNLQFQKSSPKRIPLRLFNALTQRVCRTPSSFYPIFFDFVLSTSRLARALRISGFPSAQALSIVILLKRHLSRSRIRLQS